MSAERRPQWVRTGGVCLLIIVLLWLTIGAPRRFLNSAGYLLLTGGVGTLSWYCWHAVRDRGIVGPSDDEALLIRAVPSVWFSWGVAAVVWSVVAVAITWVDLALYRQQEARFWFRISFYSAVLGLLCSWLGSFQLRLLGGVLEYWSLFGGHRELAHDEIAEARIEIGAAKDEDRFRPPIRLEVLPDRRYKSKPIFINLKVFQGKDLRLIFEWLGSKLQNEA